jgi:hypothetical protein
VADPDDLAPLADEVDDGVDVVVEAPGEIWWVEVDGIIGGVTVPSMTTSWWWCRCSMEEEELGISCWMNASGGGGLGGGNGGGGGDGGVGLQDPPSNFDVMIC